MIIALLALLGLLAVTRKGGAPPAETKPGNITVTQAEDLDPLIVTPPKPWTISDRDNMGSQKFLTIWGVYALRGYKPDFPTKTYIEEMARHADFLKLHQTAAFIRRNIGKPYEQSELIKLSLWPADEMWPYSTISVRNWLRSHMDNYTLIPKMW